MTTIVVYATQNFSGEPLADVDTVIFGNAAGTSATATFRFAQMLSGGGADILLDGSAGRNEITIDYSAVAPALAFLHFDLIDWEPTDVIRYLGGAGNDWLVTSNLASTVELIGGDGNDQLSTSALRGALYGGAGDDQMQIYNSGVGVGVETGGLGSVIYGGSGNDVATLNRSQTFGTDVSVYGGTGTDTLQLIMQDTAGLNIDFSTENTTGKIDGFGRFFEMERLVYIGRTVSGQTTVKGGDLDDRFEVTGGTFHVVANAGNDEIVVGAEITYPVAVTNGSVDGGKGTDLLRLYVGTQAVTLDISDGGGGRDIGGGLTLRNIEQVQFGDDPHYEPNLSWGNDSIRGGSLADTVWGGSGDDWVEGGAGADFLSGDAGTDTLSYGASAGAVAVNLGTGAVSGGDAQGDTIQGFENLIGGAGADMLTGTAGANRIEGNAGNDLIQGLDGDNTLVGGSGNDTMTTGTGRDTLDGGSGNDTLSAGSGNDRLTGGAGADSLTGGSGADVFVFATTADSDAAASDRITDFVRGSDIIDLVGIDASTLAFGNSAFSFIGTAAFTPGVAGQLRYVNTFNTTVVLGDTNGDGVADLRIVLSGIYALTAGDFVL